MNITVSKNELLSKLKLVGKIIQPNKVNPELDNFLFKLDAGILYVIGADDQGSITTTIKCMIDAGELLSQFTVDAKTLLDALKEIPEQPLVFNFTVNKGRIDISCRYSNGKFELAGGKGEIFPSISITGDITQIEISSMRLMYGLKQSYFCAANDELRPVMNGVYIDQQTDRLTFVASNGGTLGMMEYFSNNQSRCPFILPAKIAKILVDVIPADEDLFTVKTSSQHVLFEHPNFSIMYRMIDGRYPNYRSVIPQSNNLICTAQKSDVIAALKRVSVFCNKHTFLVKLSLSTNKMQLIAQDLDYSTSANEDVTVNYSGDKVSIGFNTNYLLEILSNLPFDEVSFHIADPSHAALIKGEDVEGEYLTYLIMPLQIN